MLIVDISKLIVKTFTISSVYLESESDLLNIPEEIFDSEIIADDLNNAQNGVQKEDIYHFKGI